LREREKIERESVCDERVSERREERVSLRREEWKRESEREKSKRK
jgi:hypothetical protein